MKERTSAPLMSRLASHRVQCLELRSSWSISEACQRVLIHPCDFFADNPLLYRIIRTTEDQIILQKGPTQTGRMAAHMADVVQCRQMRGATQCLLTKRIPDCQIINFCHVGIFRQTPSGNFDPPPPPPPRIFSGSAHYLQIVKQAKYLGATLPTCTFFLEPT